MSNLPDNLKDIAADPVVNDTYDTIKQWKVAKHNWYHGPFGPDMSQALSYAGWAALAGGVLAALLQDGEIFYAVWYTITFPILGCEFLCLLGAWFLRVRLGYLHTEAQNAANLLKGYLIAAWDLPDEQAWGIVEHMQELIDEQLNK